MKGFGKGSLLFLIVGFGALILSFALRDSEDEIPNSALALQETLVRMPDAFESRFRQAQDKGELQAQDWQSAAEFYYAKENYKEALLWTQKALAQKPKSKSLRALEVELLSILSPSSAVYDKAAALMREFPQDEGVLRLYWGVAYQTDRENLALEELHHLVETESPPTSAIRALWPHLSSLERNQILDENLRRYPAEVGLMELSALEDFFSQNYEASIEKAQRILTLSSEPEKRVRAEDLILQNLMMMNQLETALEEIERLEKDYPQAPFLAERKADILLKREFMEAP